MTDDALSMISPSEISRAATRLPISAAPCSLSNFAPYTLSLNQYAPENKVEIKHQRYDQPFPHAWCVYQIDNQAQKRQYQVYKNSMADQL